MRARSPDSRAIAERGVCGGQDSEKGSSSTSPAPPEADSSVGVAQAGAAPRYRGAATITAQPAGMHGWQRDEPCPYPSTRQRTLSALGFQQESTSSHASAPLPHGGVSLGFQPDILISMQPDIQPDTHTFSSEFLRAQK